MVIVEQSRPVVGMEIKSFYFESLAVKHLKLQLNWIVLQMDMKFCSEITD